MMIKRKFSRDKNQEKNRDQKQSTRIF